MWKLTHPERLQSFGIKIRDLLAVFRGNLTQGWLKATGYPGSVLELIVVIHLDRNLWLGQSVMVIVACVAGGRVPRRQTRSPMIHVRQTASPSRHAAVSTPPVYRRPTPTSWIDQPRSLTDWLLVFTPSPASLIINLTVHSCVYICTSAVLANKGRNPLGELVGNPGCELVSS